ncbi:hypothetical protein ACFX2I_027255 [Malus domestica]
MMGSENRASDEAHLLAPKEEMEDLVLDAQLNGNKSYSNYCSAMSSLFDTTQTLSSSPPSLPPPQQRQPTSIPFWCPHHIAISPDNSTYIDPPSYINVTFSPFDAEIAAESNGNEIPCKSSDDSNII